MKTLRILASLALYLALIYPDCLMPPVERILGAIRLMRKRSIADLLCRKS